MANNNNNNNNNFNDLINYFNDYNKTIKDLENQLKQVNESIWSHQTSLERIKELQKEVNENAKDYNDYLNEGNNKTIIEIYEKFKQINKRR